MKSLLKRLKKLDEEYQFLLESHRLSDREDRMKVYGRTSNIFTKKIVLEVTLVEARRRLVLFCNTVLEDAETLLVAEAASEAGQLVHLARSVLSQVFSDEGLFWEEVEDIVERAQLGARQHAYRALIEEAKIAVNEFLLAESKRRSVEPPLG
jgi:hypothetical protein